MKNDYWHLSITFAKIFIMGIADKLAQMKNEKAAENLKAGQEFLATNKRTQLTSLVLFRTGAVT